ncbi:hypothetical protein A2U01_0102165, partial [Trifolium medium]|nr:hypothetical protein [Trifolium medium]
VDLALVPTVASVFGDPISGASATASAFVSALGSMSLSSSSVKLITGLLELLPDTNPRIFLHQL